MKTLIIYNSIEEALRYAILDGDYSRFNGALINSTAGNGTEEELISFLFEEETGNFKIPFEEDHSLLENKQWDKVAIVTWLP